VTTAARHREADAAHLALQAALALEGGKAATEVLVAWQTLASNAPQAQQSAWLGKVVQIVMGHRATTRAMAVSYYRLVRALRIGQTIPSPGDGASSVSIEQLRREFRLLVGGSSSSGYKPASEAPGIDDILIEIDRKLTDLLKETEAAERAAELQSRIVLEAVGPKGLDKQLDAIDDSKPATEVDELRDKARAVSGAKAAGQAGRMVMDGARDTILDAVHKDPRAIGWARVSDGDPCHFCAMLLSREVFYKSKKSATRAIYGDGMEFHPNCGCTAIEVFSQDQYDNSDLFRENRKYRDEWKAVTNSDDPLYADTHALNAWRRHHTKQRAARRRAASNETALEASA
jgi:hypothetical protein